MQSTTNLLDFIMLGMGVYVLIAGIRGKGRLYSSENIKEECLEKFMRISKILYIVLGVVMTLNGIGSLARTALYTTQAVTPATESAAAYEWVLKPGMEDWSFLTIDLINIVTYVCIGAAIAILVALAVIIRKMTDKEKLASNQKKKVAGASQSDGDPKQAGHTLPVSAFDFDDEPEASAKTDEADASSAQAEQERR